MKTVSLMLAALMLAMVRATAQTPAIPPLPPFHLNFQVRYTGSKVRPELAAFIYKSLRALPGIGIVDNDPDAVIIISENLNANVYACSVVILTPQTKFMQYQFQNVLDAYEMDQKFKEASEEPTDKSSVVKPAWRTILERNAKQVRPVYTYEGSLASVDPSAKTALSFAIKSLDVNFIEKQRRQYDYMVAHPPEPFTWSPDSATNPKP